MLRIIYSPPVSSVE